MKCLTIALVTLLELLKPYKRIKQQHSNSPMNYVLIIAMTDTYNGIW